MGVVGGGAVEPTRGELFKTRKTQSYHLIDRGRHNGSVFCWRLCVRGARGGGCWRRDIRLSMLDIYTELKSAADLHTVRRTV